MCIVSYTNNFLFFHIPKCGGTSISNLISEFKSDEESLQHTHYTYQQAKKIFKDKGMLNWFNNSRKFSVVRNPHDRIASFYKYIKEQSTHYLHNKISNYNFTEFCNFLKVIGDDRINSCYDHLKDDNGIIDKTIEIFKLEEINIKRLELSKIIGGNIEQIPILNKSNHSYKMTKESHLLITEIYKKDLDYFYKQLS